MYMSTISSLRLNALYLHLFRQVGMYHLSSIFVLLNGILICLSYLK